MDSRISEGGESPPGTALRIPGATRRSQKREPSTNTDAHCRHRVAHAGSLANDATPTTDRDRGRGTAGRRRRSGRARRGRADSASGSCASSPGSGRRAVVRLVAYRLHRAAVPRTWRRPRGSLAVVVDAVPADPQACLQAIVARIRADGVAGHRQRRSTSVAAEHRLDAPHGEGGSPCRPLSAPRRVLRVSGGSQSGRLKLPAATITALRAEPLDRRSDSDVREHRSYWRALCDLPSIAAPTRARTDAWSYGHSSFARGPTR